MILVALIEPNVAAHLVHALRQHRRWCRDQGEALPAELAAVEAQLLATAGHSRPNLAGAWLDADSSADGSLALDYVAAGVVLGVSRRTVQRLVADGHLPVVEIAGCRRVRRSDLETYVEGLS